MLKVSDRTAVRFKVGENKVQSRKKYPDKIFFLRTVFCTFDFVNKVKCLLSLRRFIATLSGDQRHYIQRADPHLHTGVVLTLVHKTLNE